MYRTQRLATPYLALAALALGVGAAFGAVASLCHGWPGGAFELSAFRTLRPMHVTASVGWIFLAYLAALHYFVPVVCKTEWRSPALARLQFGLLVAAALGSPVTFLLGKFSGREYVAFVPAISLLIVAAWLAFLANFFLTVRKLPRPWPVYLWMWATGLVLFLLTFIEAHLWLLPYFRDNIARDLTVQWKSYGELVGSWNLVVYGLSIFMAEKISGDERIGRSRLAFAFYWLAVANLMFGWAHHTFQVPQSLAIRWVAFITSMTEWVVLAHMLLTWDRRSQPAADPARGVAQLFLRSANVWIGINLCLALLISVPALNALTHGTHVTIAHAVGATIGINTMILLSCVFYILVERTGRTAGFRILVPWVNVCLAGLFVSLLVAGSIKGKEMLLNQLSFYSAMEAARTFLKIFAISGIGLAIGLVALAARAVFLLRAAPVPAAAWSASTLPIPRLAYAVAVLVVPALPWWLSPPPTPEPTPMALYPRGEAPRAARGRAIFAREGCWKCHTAPGAFNAPDLLQDGPAWSEGWHAAHLWDPRLCRSDSVMPHYPHLIEQAESAELIEYLKQLQRERARVLSASLEGTRSTTGRGDAARGATLYRAHCASCHGDEGRGDGPAARFFSGEVRPRDFTIGVFRNRSTEDFPTEDDVWRTLTHGMPGSGMAAFHNLSDHDRRDIAAHVRGLSGRPDNSPVPVSNAANPALVERGRKVFDRVGCAVCHGQDLMGLDAARHGFSWTDESGRPVPRSTDLTSGIFKSGSGPERLYRTLFYGRGGAPMPWYAEMIPDETDRWALVEYLRSIIR